MSLRAHLVRGIFGSLGLTIASAGLAFINGVLLARLLGASGYGVYAAAIAVVWLMAVPLTLGFAGCSPDQQHRFAPFNTGLHHMGYEPA